jgi:hypothetical protein
VLRGREGKKKRKMKRSWERTREKERKVREREVSSSIVVLSLRTLISPRTSELILKKQNG